MTDTAYNARFPAFGGTAIVAVVEAGQLAPARAAVEKTVASFDLACSRFREDSELSALNAARGHPMKASPLLLDAVQAALRAARLTAGDVDPTIGEALIALGYDRDFNSVGASSSVSIASVPGWQTVTIDPDQATIRVARGVKLDLGATAKPLAADRAATAAFDASGGGVLVSLGGDIAIAGPAPPGGWRVRVTDDHRSGVGAPGQWITLAAGGLATSSTTVRRWRAGGEIVHHLLDPRTGRSAAATWRTASVAAESCLDANTASTASIVRGQDAVGWLESLSLPARLVDVNGSAHHVAGWPAAGEDLPLAVVAGGGRGEAIAR